MIDGKRVALILPAAGSGRRFGGRSKKQFRDIAGRPIWTISISVFQAHPAIDLLVVVVPADMVEETRIHPMVLADERIRVVAGGEQRQDSVWNGIAEARSFAPDIILVHDAVRPCVTAALIDRLLDALRSERAAIPVISPADTVRILGDSPGASKVVPRETVFMVQTPQAFDALLLHEAFDRALRGGVTGTDEASLVEHLGVHIALVEGERENFKITSPADMEIAASILERRRGISGNA